MVSCRRVRSTRTAGSWEEDFMRIRMLSQAVLSGLLLVPVLTFAKPDCKEHPDNPNCVVTVPEHWGVLESLGFCALVLIAFWVMIRLKVLWLNSKA